MTPQSIPADTTIHVAGHRGLVGSSIRRLLKARNFARLVGAPSHEVDLRDFAATRALLRKNRPDIVIDAAAHVDGALANSTKPVEFLSDNLRIQLNLMEGAAEVGVERFLFLGSGCICPQFVHEPIPEGALLTVRLEEENAAYAIAKIAVVTAVQAHRKECSCALISAVPTNLYGPSDNYDPETPHVLPALIGRFGEAARSGATDVVLWGTDTPRREFLYVDELASGCLFLLEQYDAPLPIIVGIGTDASIRELAEIFANVTRFTGEIVQDASKPDGTPRKLLDVSRIRGSGGEPRIALRDGFKATHDWLVNYRVV